METGSNNGNTNSGNGTGGNDEGMATRSQMSDIDMVDAMMRSTSLRV